jgi:hypothetical protein
LQAIKSRSSLLHMPSENEDTGSSAEELSLLS